MSNVGFATLSIIPSAKGFAPALDRQVGGGMTASGRKGGALLGAGLVATAAKFAAPLAGALAIGKILKTGFAEAGDAAANNAQLAAGIRSTGNAANVTIPGLNKLASTIQLYSGQTDDSISRTQALLLTFTKIQNAGPDKIFDRATIAAADMAARMGGDASSSAIQLGKALNDPIKGVASLARVGVQFTQSQKDSIAALVANGDQIGAQKIILKELETQFGGSAKAAGQTFPGQVNILSRSFEDFSQMLVERFTPGIGAALGFLSSGLQKATPVVDAALDKIGAKFGDASTLIKAGFTGSGSAVNLGPLTAPLLAAGEQIRSIFDGIIAAVQPFMPAITASFSALLPQLLQLLPALSPLGLVFKALTPVFPQLAAMVAQLAAALGPLLGTVLSTVTPIVQLLVSTLSGVFVQILPVLSTLIGTLAAALGPIATVIGQVLQAVMPLVAELLGALAPILTQLISTILPPVAQIFGVIVGAIAPLISMLAGLLIPIIKALLPVVTTVFGVIADVITSVMQIVQGVIDVVVGVISGNWGQAWNGIKGIFSGVWNLILSIVKGAAATLWSVIKAAVSIVQSIWSGAWKAVSSFIGTVWSNITRAVSTGVGNVVRFFRELPGKVISTLAGFARNIFNVGKNIVQGLLDGIKSIAGNIGNALLSPVKDAVNGVKNFLGIHSPSRLLYGIGKNTVLGEVNALNDGAALIAKASEGLVPTLPTDFTTPTVTPGGLTGSIANAANAQSPVFVQNPFTGEYLLAQVDERVTAGIDAEAREFEKGFRK